MATILEKIYEDVLNLGYPGDSVNKDTFVKAFDSGQPNVVFVNVVAWMSSQFVQFCNLECKITPFEDSEDLEMKGLGFVVELSSLLKELNCPIKSLLTTSMSDRLTNAEYQIDTLTYLCSELQAAKMIYVKNPKKQLPMKIELDESRTAKELKEMLISLNFGKPPDNITPKQLFGEVDKKIYVLSQSISPKDFVGERLFSGVLTEKQWFLIDNLYLTLFQEYEVRRKLLLTRLDVTIQSFLWADRLKAKAEEIKSSYAKQRSILKEEPNVKISNILAASKDLIVLEKTSSGNVRKNTKCSVNKVIIGAVPDRGGRPEEQQPPPPEIPSWQKNEPANRGSFRGGDRQQQGRGGGDRQQQGRGGGDRQQQGRGGYGGGGGGGGGRQRQDENWKDNRSGQYQSSRQGDNQRYDSNKGQRDINPNTPRNTQSFDPYANSQGNYNSMYNNSGYVQPMNTAYAPPQYGGGGFGGFGGYGAPAGDNFAQYGNYQPNQGGDAQRQGGRGGNYNRGSRPYRGNRGGRQRY